MKLTKPFMTGFPGGGGSTPSGKGHLFGDALFNADFFQLQNTEGEEIIKYTKEGGLEIAGGGIGVFVKHDGSSAEKINESAEACVAVIQEGKRPVLITGTNNELFWDCYKGKVDEFIFATFTIDFDAKTVIMLCRHLYKQNGTWVQETNPFDLV